MDIWNNNDSSSGSSNSSTCNIRSCRTFLIWVGIVTSEVFSLTRMIWFSLYSSLITNDDIKFRGKRNKSCYRQNSRNKLFISICSAVFTIFKQANYLFMPSWSLFCFSKKVSSKNLPLVSRGIMLCEKKFLVTISRNLTPGAPPLCMFCMIGFNNNKIIV